MKHAQVLKATVAFFAAIALLGGSALYSQGAVGTGSIGGSEDGGPVGSGSIGGSIGLHELSWDLGPQDDDGPGGVDILPLSAGGAGLTVAFGPEGANGTRPFWIYGDPTEIDGAPVSISGTIESGKAFVVELKPDDESGDYLTPPYGWPKLRFFDNWDPDDAGTNDGKTMGRIYNNNGGQRLVKW